MLHMLSQVMECFMARKPPSSEDLKELLPVIWWPGCKDETASEAKMRVSEGDSRVWVGGEVMSQAQLSKSLKQGRVQAVVNVIRGRKLSLLFYL
jgi:hypothetical protein